MDVDMNRPYLGLRCQFQMMYRSTIRSDVPSKTRSLRCFSTSNDVSARGELSEKNYIPKVILFLSHKWGIHESGPNRSPLSVYHLSTICPWSRKEELLFCVIPTLLAVSTETWGVGDAPIRRVSLATSGAVIHQLRK